MFGRFINFMDRMGGASDFEAYWRRLQRDSASGGPSVEEARKDYQAIDRYRVFTY